MEVARLEARYVADISDFERKSAQADARFKRTAQQAHTTERVVQRAFRATSQEGGKLSDVFRGLSNTTAALDGPLGGVSGRLSSLSSLTVGLTTTTGALGVAIGALAVTTVGASAAIFSLTTSVANATGRFIDLSQQTGFSVETLSALANAAETSGGSIDTVSSSLNIFQANMVAAREKGSEMSALFKVLKIDTQDNEKALRQALTAIMGLTRAEDQAAVGKKLLGRGFKELNAAVKEAGSLDAYLNDQLRRGTLITTEAAQRGDQLSDSVIEMGRAFESARRIVADQFGPDVLKVVKEITGAIERNRSSISEWAKDIKLAAHGAVDPLVASLTNLNNILLQLSGLSIPDVLGFLLKFGTGAGLIFTGLKNIGAATQGGAVTQQTQSDILRMDRALSPINTSRLQTMRGRNPFEATADPFQMPKGTGAGGGGGKKSPQQDILEGLRSTLISLNTEWRKWDVALLDSATSSALAAQKQTLLDNVMSSLSSKTKLVISGIRDIDEALDKAVSSLPKKSQAAAQALIQESLAQFKSNEQRRIAGEINKEAERLTQSWRLEIDNSRSGADEFTKAIQGLEKAYSKYGLALEPTTRAELEHLAAQQRLLRVTRERLTVLNQMRQRVVGEDVLRDLGQGSVAFRGEASRDRIATVGETVLREREQMRIQEMREIAEDLGSIFGDAFDSIRDGWESLWQDMAQVARSISRQFIQDLFTGMFSRAFNVPFQSQSGGIVGSWINRIFGGGAPIITDLGGNSTFMPGGTGAIRPRIAGARATGGPVEAGRLYQINERGTEYFRPTIGGQIIPLGQEQSNSGVSRLYLVDDERAAFERGATRREIAKVNKQMRKVGKLVPGF